MSQDIKEVVKRTLVQFDWLCKELEKVKRATAPGKSTSSEIQKLRAELAKHQAEQQKLRADFERWENECRELIQKNADKNKKKIKKIYSKLAEDVEVTTEVERKAKETEARLQAVMQAEFGEAPAIDQLKKQYATTFEIIQGFRQTIPDVYNEAEQETGIYFFTMPK
jgi:predicted RNase H-like nuclease (RuvC/YqgF family)